MSEAGGERDYVTVARVLRSRGNRGEVAVGDLSDGADRFPEGMVFSLKEPGGGRRAATLERSWRHQGRLILKFEGIDSISEAETLRGCEVQITRQELGAAPEGHYYFDQLIGCRVIDAGTERVLGEVERVIEAGGSTLLQVDSKGKEILIPFARSICVDVALGEKTIRVQMPEGLEDLNS